MKINHCKRVLRYFVFSVVALMAMNGLNMSGYAKSPALSWPDGSQYSGEISNNLPEGKGRMVWASGSTYDGDWQNGRRTGKGVYVWSTKQHFRGDFLNDELHGKGTSTWPDGTWYEGEWEHNRRTGKGVLVMANGERYTGDFLNDKPHGAGTMLYKTGNSVSGIFAFGVLRKPNPNIFFDGSDTQGVGAAYKVTALPDGKFLVEYPNGNFYKGDFSEGWFEGKGVFTFADGTSLSGTFHTNRFVYGKKTYADGTWYLGSLTENYSRTKDGKKHTTSIRHGFGTYYDANGTILRQGHWFSDSFVESSIPAESPRPFGPDDEDILI